MELVSELWNAMAITGKLVVAILGALSVYSYAVMVDRGLALRWNQERSVALAQDIEAADPALGAEPLLAKIGAAQAKGHCALATVLAAGLEEYQQLKGEEAPAEVVLENVEAETARTLDVAVANLRVRLPNMATIVGIAPFLGLFGTVTGLINAFRGIASSGGGGLSEISAGISEALVTTVIGLFVAMPALWAYNHFMNRVDIAAIGLHTTSARLVLRVVRGLLRHDPPPKP